MVFKIIKNGRVVTPDELNEKELHYFNSVLAHFVRSSIGIDEELNSECIEKDCLKDRPDCEICGIKSEQEEDLFKRSEEQVLQEVIYNDFADVLAALKAGYRVAREGWNGKGMYLYYVPAGTYATKTEAARAEFGDEVPYTGYIAMRTAQGYVTPWTPSQIDLFSEDWLIFPANN